MSSPLSVSLSISPPGARLRLYEQGAGVAALMLGFCSFLAGCGGPSTYSVATCAFGSTETQCTPVPAEGARSQHELHFALIDPNSGAPHGCSEATLDVNDSVSGSGKMHWHGQEKSPTACAAIGAELQGAKDIGTGQTVDLHFPSANFTFRMEVKPVDP